MIDPLLQIFAHAANENKEESAERQTVSLLVGGFLVSGVIIGYDEFVREHVGVEPEQELPEPGTATDETPNFIHLRDAQCLGGLGVVPSDKGMYLRIPIASISGFSLTRISRGAQKAEQQ